MLLPLRPEQNQTNASTNVSIAFSNDTVAPLQTFYADINLSGIASDSIYGLSFTLNLDYNKIDFNNILVSTTGSLMGTDSLDMISFNKPLLASNELGLAITGLDLINRAASGNVFRIYLKALNVLQIDSVNISLTSIRANDALGQNVLINAASATLIIDPAFTGIEESAYTYFAIPSLINNQLKFDNTIGAYNVSLINSDGKIVLSKRVVHGIVEINTADFANGVYCVQVTSANRSINRKTVIVH